MAWILVGLGNPGEDYEHTRHNVGRDFLASIADKEDVGSFKADKKLRSLVLRGELFGKKATLLLPETFMNNSGGAVKPLVDSPKKAKNLVVLHDDLDLPLGRVKISVGSGAGGHKGVESIQKAVKTKEFARIRIGVAPHTPSGKTKKVDSKKVVDFVVGEFRKSEDEELKKVKKIVKEALELILTDSVARAMNVIHSK